MNKNRFTAKEAKIAKILFLPFYIFCWIKPIAFLLYSIIDAGAKETFFDNSAIFKAIRYMQEDGTFFFYMLCALIVLSAFLLLYGRSFKTYQAVGAALNIPLYLFVDLGICINSYRIDEPETGEIIIFAAVAVLIVYAVTTSVMGAIGAINKSEEDHSLRTASIVYIINWSYLACVALPVLLWPVSKVLGAAVFSDYIDIFLDFNTHMGAMIAFPTLICSLSFAIFLGLLLLKKVGAVRAVITVLANIIMISSLMYLQISGMRHQIGETKSGVILLMFAVLVLLLTLSAVLKAEGSENKLTTVIEKATPFVAAAAIVVMLVSAFIPAENFKRKRNSNVTLDLSQYTVSDIAEMSPDELGELAGKYNEAYAPFD